MKKSGVVWKKVFTRPGSPLKNEPFLWGVGFKKNDIFLSGNSLIFSKAGQDTWYVDEADWDKFYSEISKKAAKLSYLKENANNTRLICENIINYSSRVKKTDYSGQTINELIETLDNIYKLYSDLNFNLWAFWVLESYLGKILDKTLTKLLKDVGKTDKFLEYKTILSAKTDLIEAEREELSLLEIKATFQREGLSKKVIEALENHVSRFAWIPVYEFTTKPWTKKHFLNILKELPEDPENEIEKRRQKIKNSKKQIQNILKEFKDKTLTDIVNILQDYLILKTYRTDTLRKSFYNLLEFVNLLSKELKIPPKYLVYLSISEIKKILKKRKPISFNELKKRSRLHLIIKLNNKVSIISDSKKVNAFLKSELEEGNLNLDIIGGMPASLGKATGRVKIINSIKESRKMKNGDILVSRMTFPDLVITMRKAAAIVTDEGGITCHAAIVSRELGIPCIVGTKNSTKVLSDDDVVEVNANSGTVKRISRAT